MASETQYHQTVGLVAHRMSTWPRPNNTYYNLNSQTDSVEVSVNSTRTNGEGYRVVFSVPVGADYVTISDTVERAVEAAHGIGPGITSVVVNL